MKSSNEKDKKTVVIDTSALIAGFDPFSIKEEQFVAPKVREEITEDNMCWVRFKTALENERVRVKMPQESFIEKTKVLALQVGDSFLLSDTDIQVLSLALELKTNGYVPTIATDDYSIQNVASAMDIQFAPLSTFGIRRRLQWMRYCPACHKKYATDYASTKCQICGTKLKRKPMKKTAPSV